MNKKFEKIDILFYSGISIFTAIVILPIIHLVSVSLSGKFAVTAGLVTLYPIDINLDAYKVILSDELIVRSYMNTVFYAFSGTIITIILSCFAAYPLSIRDFKGRGIFTVMMVITMFFNGGMIPTFMLIKDLGMIDTIWAIIIPTAISAYYVIIMRTFFMGLPNSLRESAFIEGANDFTILWKIIIPLSKPVIYTIVLFSVVAKWNEFFAPLLYLNNKNLFPIQIILRKLVIANEIMSADNMMADFDELIVAQSIKAAALIFTILPITFVYPYIQKHFTKGVMIGSLKG